MTQHAQIARRPALAVAALLAIGVVVLQGLLVPLFAAPAANLEPRDLPIVVEGPAPAAAGFAAKLEAARPGAFNITTVADANAADRALRERDAYASFIVGPNGVALHTASAASPTVALLLTQAATQLGNGQAMPVTDVVSTDPDDPRGAGFAAGFLPLALTSMIAGILLTLVLRRDRPAQPDKGTQPFRLAGLSWAAPLAGVVTFAALGGLMAVAVLHGWLGVLPGSYLASAAAIALFALAVSAALAGLGFLLGQPGLGLGALLVFMVGNPLSGVSAAPELLPQPWGEVGQWLPIGAGGTLLRSAAYFDWAGSTHAVWVLTGWALAGLALIVVGQLRRRPAKGATATASQFDAAPALTP